MAHPENKRDRVKTGITKAKKRCQCGYHTEKDVKKLRDTTKMCSCAGCGNPRKFFNEPTRAEKKNEDKFNDELKEL